MEQNNINRSIEEILNDSISPELRIKLNQDLLKCKKMFNPSLKSNSIVKYIKPEIIKFDDQPSIFEIFSKPYLLLERMLKLEPYTPSLENTKQKLESNYNLTNTFSDEYNNNYNHLDGYDKID